MGPEDGNYFKTGLAYAEFLKQKGIDPRVRETAGSLENFNLLTNATDATRLGNAGAAESIAMLEREEVDAIVRVLSPQAPVIRQLLLEERYRLFNFERR